MRRYDPFILPASELGPARVPLVGLVGLPLTRKTLFCERAVAAGCRVVSTGDYVREECRRRGITPCALGCERVAGELTKNGEAGLLEPVLAQLVLCQETSKAIVLDTVKTPYGVHFLKREFRHVVLVACLASPGQRWRAAIKRGRADVPESMSEFRMRDKREVTLGVGTLLAYADYFLLAGEFEATRLQCDKILASILSASDKEGSGANGSR